MSSDRLVIIYDERQLALSTLAASTALVSITKLDASLLQGFRIAKMEGWADLNGKTDTEGPIVFGFGIGVDATRIKNAIDADPQDGSHINAEAIAQGKEPLWVLGMFSRAEQHCVPIHFEKKVNWSMIEGRHAEFWVYNMDGGALTTGATLEIFVKFWGVFLND